MSPPLLLLSTFDSRLTTLIHTLLRFTASHPSISTHSRNFLHLVNDVRLLFVRIVQLLGSSPDAGLSGCFDQLAILTDESEKCLKIWSDIDWNVFWERDFIEKLLFLTQQIECAVEGILMSGDVSSRLQQISEGFLSSSEKKSSNSRLSSSKFDSSSDCPNLLSLFRDLKTTFASNKQKDCFNSKISSHTPKLSGRSFSLRSEFSEAATVLEGINVLQTNFLCEENQTNLSCKDDHGMLLDLQERCISVEYGSSDSFTNHDKALPESSKPESGDSDLQDMARGISTLAGANAKQLQASLDDLKSQFSTVVKSLESLYLTGKSYPNPWAAVHARHLLYHLLHGEFRSNQSETPCQSSSSLCSPFSTVSLDSNAVGEKSFAQKNKAQSSDQSSQSHRFLHEKLSEDIKLRLLDPGGPTMVGLCGESGVGKTHLAATVACESEVQEQFLGGIFWLSFGHFPNLLDLQASLWMETVSKSSFASVEDGLIKLKKKFADGLPVLLILDDLCETAQIEAFKVIEDKDKGRILVTSRRREVLEGGDVEVVFMDSMNEDQALGLFISSAGYEHGDAGAFLPIAKNILQGYCKIPVIIQAIATSLYRERDIQTWQIAQKFLTEGPLLHSNYGVSKESVGNADVSSITQQKGLKNSKSETLQFLDDSQPHSVNNFTKGLDYKRKEAISHGLAWCVNKLRFIHPLFQDCFMDLAAYPAGEYVSTESLGTLWRYGNKMAKDEVFVCLSFLQSRSMVEFKVDPNKGACELGQCISWKLPSKFHEFLTKESRHDWKLYSLSQRVNLVKKQAHSAFNWAVDLKLFGRISKWKRISDEQSRDSHSSKLLTETLSFETNIFCLPEVSSPSFRKSFEYSTEDSNASKMVAFKSLMTEQGFINENIMKEVEDERGQIRLKRLFLPFLKLDQITMDSIDHLEIVDLLKLSLVGSDITKVKGGLQFPSLQIALLTDNKKLKRIIPSAFQGMQKLLVLDLRGCSSLKELPATVSLLESLQVLDLRFCTNLCTLPKSIGYLRNLHLFKLSGCAALTYLPRSVGLLQSLEVLEMIGCKELRYLPSTIGHLSSLSILNLHGCSSLHTLPTSIDLLKKLQVLELSGCSNVEYILSLFEKLKLLLNLQKPCAMAVPMGIWRMSNIETLGLSSLKNLTFLPSRIVALQHLRNLSLSDCRLLEFLPEELGTLSLLQELDLSHTAVRKLPESLGKLERLKHLYLQGCARLLSVPDSISHLPSLELLDLSACWDLVKVPDTFGGSGSFPELRELNMSGCSIKALPSLSKSAFPKLKILKLANCANLCTLPSNFGTHHLIQHVDLEGCSSLTSLHGTGFGDLKKLAWLNLRNCTQLTLLPASELASMDSLKFLDVSGCSRLSPFPQVLLTRASDHSLKLIRWGALWH